MGTGITSFDSRLSARHWISACGTAILLSGVSLACGRPQAEVPVQEARPGDLLVAVEGEAVYLESTFRPGVPNGLYDGSVRIQRESQADSFMEVNAVCSLPDLPGWPPYDNIYGRRLKDATEAGKGKGDTQWQTLLPFDGAPREIGAEPSPAWALRLAQNLCRKGDFSENPANGRPQAPGS
jgi:hypothetical protein